MDFAERAHHQWHTIAPDIDLSPLLTTGRLQRIASFVTARSEQRLAEFGINRGEFNLLSVVRRSGKNCRATELSALTESSGAAITKRLERLVAKDLVVRKELPSDRRVVLVSLTDKGRDLIDHVFPLMVELEREFIAPLNEGQRHALEEALAIMLQHADPSDI